MRRREFVAGAAAGVAAFALPGLAAASQVKPIGLQLYSVRRLMQDDVGRTLQQVAAAGYAEVETAGYFGLSPREFRRLLDLAGLAAPSAHVPIEAVGDQLPATLDAAATIGHTYLVVPSVPAAMRESQDTWRAVAARLNAAATIAAAHGITIGYHNHDVEFTPLDDVLPYDILLQETDRGRVVFELDLFWIRKGGQDALQYFAKWPGRFPMVHVKDMAADGSQVDVGQGVIDWQAIYAARKAAGIEHWFVEHDDPKDPLAFIRASAAYLGQLR